MVWMVASDENVSEVWVDAVLNEAVPFGTVGFDDQFAPLFQLLSAGVRSQVPSVACALTAPRHTPAISPARIV